MTVTRRLSAVHFQLPPLMLSFVLRRTLLRSGTVSTAAKLPSTRPILPSRLTWVIQRSLVTTTSDLSSGSIADSEPEPGSKLKPNGKKAGSSTSRAGKGKTKNAKRRAKTGVKQKSMAVPYAWAFV